MNSKSVLHLFQPLPLPIIGRAIIALGIYSILSISNIHGAWACATDTKVPVQPKAAWKDYWKAHCHSPARSPRRLSSSLEALPSGKQNPWGGPNTTKWRAEAFLANSVSEALNEGWAEPNVKDVLVALPVQMRFSNLRPYADGQTNAAVTFLPEWTPKEPPLIATLILFQNGDSKLRLRFHRSFQFTNNGAHMIYQKDGKVLSQQWHSWKQISTGDFELEWTPTAQQVPQWGDLFTNHVAFVQPDGWQDWFPLDFRDVVKPANDLLSQVPKSKQRLGKGSLLDPENVSVQSSPNSTSYPFLKMKSDDFGKDINADRYFPVPGSGIHNEFPDQHGTFLTAVGHGNTLVMVNQPAPFKLAYICFDARNPQEEAKYGVPSGGGWHEIGDPAETVLNTLENAPVVFGYANGRPATATPSGNFAYGLKDIVVVRKLKPGDALITAAGPTTAAEDASGWQNRGNQDKPEGRNYHWFIFDQTHEVCATEWVHPSIPSPTNHLGLDQL